MNLDMASQAAQLSHAAFRASCQRPDRPQEGRLVEEGSPAELHQRDGVFAEYARAHQDRGRLVSQWW